MKYRVLIEQDEDGMFVVEVPALPGCLSQGHTREEAIQNVQEAISLYLESLKAHDEPIPRVSSINVAPTMAMILVGSGVGRSLISRGV